jgi:hypothetical protein
MEKAKFAALAVMLTVSSAAFAQTGTMPAPATPAPAPTPKTAAGETPANSADLQQQLTVRLQKAGFTDVKVLPDSFLVRADDKSGNAVMMSITPDSMTELTRINASGQNASGQNKSTSADGMFTSIPTGDRLSSSVIGLDVYNDQNQDIGTIKDMAMDSSGLSAYIIGVGGYLGMGDHYVAVRPSAISLKYNADDQKWHATMNANAAELKSAPEYKYPSKS